MGCPYSFLNIILETLSKRHRQDVSFKDGGEKRPDWNSGIRRLTKGWGPSPRRPRWRSRPQAFWSPRRCSGSSSTGRPGRRPGPGGSGPDPRRQGTPGISATGGGAEVNDSVISGTGAEIHRVWGDSGFIFLLWQSWAITESMAARGSCDAGPFVPSCDSGVYKIFQARRMGLKGEEKLDREQRGTQTVWNRASLWWFMPQADKSGFRCLHQIKEGRKRGKSDISVYYLKCQNLLLIWVLRVGSLVDLPACCSKKGCEKRCGPGTNNPAAPRAPLIFHSIVL